MDNDNGTASGRPCRNRRAPTQYNPQYNVPASQWVSNKQAAVAKYVLDSALGGIFSMDSWGEIRVVLAYQVVDRGTLTHVDTTIFTSQQGVYPYEPGLVEVLSIPQSEQWTKAMTEEINNLVKRRTWDVIQKYEVPEGSNIILGTWYFKCKCFPDGSFRKFKAWLCVRGYIQKRVSDVPIYTYAPVVQCSNVSLIQVITCIMGLNIQATEFINAFSHDKLKHPVYLQPPAKYSDASWGENPIL